MEVKDILSPSFSSPTFYERANDFFGLSNNKDMYNFYNNYGLQKAINVNKYQWNKQGMIAAGINPLVATSNLNSVSNGTPSNMDPAGGIIGKLLEAFTALIHKV